MSTSDVEISILTAFKEYLDSTIKCVEAAITDPGIDFNRMGTESFNCIAILGSKTNNLLNELKASTDYPKIKPIVDSTEKQLRKYIGDIVEGVTLQLRQYGEIKDTFSDIEVSISKRLRDLAEDPDRRR